MCAHSHPPGCRAGPRPKDQVLFLKTLHLGVGWLDPCRVSLAGWVLGSHDHHIHHAGIRLTCRDRFAGGEESGEVSSWSESEEVASWSESEEVSSWSESEVSSWSEAGE